MAGQILNRSRGSLAMLRVGLFALSVVSLHVMAAPPSMKTVGQLYREENAGEDPDRMMNGGIWGRVIAMHKGIPRDFPLPASSRNLAVSGVMPKSSVTGTMEIAEAFYSEVLPLQGWHIYRRIKIQGSAFSLVACKVSQCVTLNAFHQGAGAGASDESDELDKSDESDADDEADDARGKAISSDEGQDPTIGFVFYKKEDAPPSTFQKGSGKK